MLKKIVLIIVAANSLSYTSSDNKSVQKSRPLDCVTHISGIQKIIADYCDQEWVQDTERQVENITSFACSPNGRYIAYALCKKKDEYITKTGINSEQVIYAAPQVEIWDTQTNKIEKSIVEFNLKKAAQLIFSRDNKYLAAVSFGLYFYDIAAQKWMQIEADRGWQLPFAADRGGTHGWLYSNLEAAAFSPDGNYLALFVNDSSYRIEIVARDGSSSRTINIEQDFFCKKLSYSSDGTKILGWATGDKRILVVDVITNKVTIVTLPHDIRAAEAVALLPFKNCIAMPSQGIGILVHNYITGEKKYSNQEDFVGLVALAAVPSKYVACANNNFYANGEIKICDLSNYPQENITVINGHKIDVARFTMPLVHIIPACGKSVKSLHCSTDGKYLTAEYHSGLIKRWINLSHYLLEKYKSKE